MASKKWRFYAAHVTQPEEWKLIATIYDEFGAAQALARFYRKHDCIPRIVRMKKTVTDVSLVTWQAVEAAIRGKTKLQADLILQFWDQLVREFGDTWRKPPHQTIPFVQANEEKETVRFSWSRQDKFLDFEVWDDGKAEWFLYMESATINSIDGTGHARESVEPSVIIDLLKKHFNEPG